MKAQEFNAKLTNTIDRSPKKPGAVVRMILKPFMPLLFDWFVSAFKDLLIEYGYMDKNTGDSFL